MNKQNMLLGVVIVGLLGTGIWWMSQPAPAPAAEKAAAVPATVPEPKIAAPVTPPKAVVEAPKAPVAAPSANLQPVTAPAAKPAVDPELKLAMDNLILTLETQDVSAFVQNFIAPNMMALAREAASRQMPANASPEMQAQIEQVLQQRVPQMIQQITEQLSSDPRATQNFQKLGAALKLAATNPPEMNATSDRATYTIETNGDKDMPPAVSMVLHDGKWTLDFMSMVRAGTAQ